MHYDLDFLLPGNRWPAKEDEERLAVYNFAREQFELTPEDQIRAIVPDGLMRFAEYKDFVHSTKLLGYPRLLTLKTVDMLIGQPPLIAAQADEKLTERIREVRGTCKFNDALKLALIDFSRFGVALLRVFKNEKGRAALTAWNPNDWTPVFYADGTNRIRYNVIGWFHGKNNEKLTLQIHDTQDGRYEERICEVDSTGIIDRIVSSKVYNKTSGKQLLYAIINTPTTTNPLGTNDYEIINGLLQKAIQRLQAILRVLDEHADPSMTGPHSMLSRTEDGELVFKTSKYYAVGNGEQKPEYLVWEANLDSSFKAFEELCRQIFVLSEMGEAFLGSSSGVGNVVSGTAMRFKMISPLEKARRINNELAEPLKEIISTLLSIEHEEIDPKDVSITWRDSLPKDPREVAELARLESGSIAVKPLLNAIMDNYDLDLESAQAYVDAIEKAQQRLREQADGDLKKSTIDEDGRSHGPQGSTDVRKKGSSMDPASSENRGDDQNAKLN